MLNTNDGNIIWDFQSSFATTANQIKSDIAVPGNYTQRFGQPANQSTIESLLTLDAEIS